MNHRNGVSMIFCVNAIYLQMKRYDYETQNSVK